MPDSETSVQGGLTWKVLKQVFPVAASLRREHWDLFFKTGVSESQRNEDEPFYGALLHKFRRDGGFAVELDRRFLGSKKKKDREKAFTYRASRWLVQNIPELFSYDDILDAPVDLFGDATAERDLRDLIVEMRRVEREAKARLAPLAEERWKSAGAELRGLLGELDRPTPDAVERIEAAAEALLEAGREVRKQAAELERSRADIRILLEAFPDLGRAAETLARLEALGGAQLAELAEIAHEARTPIDALAEAEISLAAKEKEFERQRAEGASWSAIARQAEALAELEAERNRQLAAVEAVLARMAAASAAAETGPPPARDRTETRSRRKVPAAGRAAEPADGDRPAGGAAEDGAAEPAGKTVPPPPASWDGFAGWCETHLGDRLALSPRACNSIKKARYEDVELAAHCLAWLAGDYRRARLEGAGNSLQGPVPAGSGVRNDRCGGDSFEFDWQGKRLQADWHIKSGGNTRDPARCLRIYYCWHEDDRGGQVVVADMPAHVRSRAT